jgi:hypothetical protein
MNVSHTVVVISKGALDLLKNKELDRTTTVVLCLILKMFTKLDKLGVLSLTKSPDNLLSQVQVSKIAK